MHTHLNLNLPGTAPGGTPGAQSSSSGTGSSSGSSQGTSALPSGTAPISGSGSQSTQTSQTSGAQNSGAQSSQPPQQAPPPSQPQPQQQSGGPPQQPNSGNTPQNAGNSAGGASTGGSNAAVNPPQAQGNPPPNPPQPAANTGPNAPQANAIPGPDLAALLAQANADAAHWRTIAVAATTQPLANAALLPQVPPATNTPLPPVVAGFQADPLDLPIPPKVADAVKHGKYVPYPALSHAARVAAASGEEELTINARGGLTAKGLDRRGELQITELAWVAAGDALVEATRIHCKDDDRADKLAAHHKSCVGIARKHGFRQMLLYDITQRELAATHPRHDLSIINATALISALNTPAPAAAATRTFSSAESFAPGPSGDSSSTAASQAKRFRTQGICFRCGGAGHLPGDCKATKTVAGRPTAAIAPGTRHGLLAVGGNHVNQQYCLAYARDGRCPRDQACTFFHGCSLCNVNTHGAGRHAKL